MEISLYAKYHSLFLCKEIKESIKHKLMNLYFLYSNNTKLWTEKNFNKLHLIADKYLKN